MKQYYLNTTYYLLFTVQNLSLGSLLHDLEIALNSLFIETDRPNRQPDQTDQTRTDRQTVTTTTTTAITTTYRYYYYCCYYYDHYYCYYYSI